MEPVVPPRAFSLLLLVLVVGLAAGCRPQAGDVPADPARPEPVPVTEAEPEADAEPPGPAFDDQPDEDVPPATVGGFPAEGVIGFAGFGPAPFGADQEQVRMAWGRDLGDAAPSEPGGCYYLMPQPVPADGYRIAFMIEGDRFERIDVRDPGIAAPGGGRVGMAADEIASLYPGRIETRPHKYVDGARYLRIADEAGGEGVLLFETGADGQVTAWRIGRPPQVDYVEGCS